MLAVYFFCPENHVLLLTNTKKQYTSISGNEISGSIKKYRIKRTNVLFGILHVAMKVEQYLQRVNAKFYFAEGLSHTLKPMPEIIECFRSAV